MLKYLGNKSNPPESNYFDAHIITVQSLIRMVEQAAIILLRFIPVFIVFDETGICELRN